MTRAEQNDIIKRAWTRKLRDRSDIPESIGETYAAWLQGKIKLASQQLTAVGQAQQQQQLAQAQAQGQSQEDEKSV